MLVPVFLFAAGLILLIKGGDWFVDSATGMAHRFRMPELLIGATVVSIGTTLPEVMVSATSVLGGHSEIAYGNIIGPIICNASLVAALTIAIRPGTAQRKALLTPVAFFFGAAGLYSIIAYTTGHFSRPLGFVLLAIFVVYMLLTVRQMKNSPDEAAAQEEVKGSMTKDICMLVIGAVCIAFGARLLVDNGTLIAQALGVPESAIALTLVSLGTSVPELTTAVTSLIKGHGALSLGNVIGANLFNLVLVSGVSMVLAPFDIPQSASVAGMNASLAVDIPVMFAVMLLLTVPAILRQKLSRWQGVTLLCIYAVYCIFQFTL